MENTKNLPEVCYSVLKSTGEVICIRRFEKGYYKTDVAAHNADDARIIADYNNNLLGVTKAQESAMVVGSMFGWTVPGADPKNYDENGKLIKKGE